MGVLAGDGNGCFFKSRPSKIDTRSFKVRISLGSLLQMNETNKTQFKITGSHTHNNPVKVMSIMAASSPLFAMAIHITSSSFFQHGSII